MKKFVGRRAKTYSYLIDDAIEEKKAKGTKKCVIKRQLKSQDHKNFLETTQLENKMNYLKVMKLMWIVLKKILQN